MDKKEATTDRVARWLRRAGLNEPAAFLIEAAGPLALIGAQAAFLVEPLFAAHDSPIGDLGRLLEDPIQVSMLVKRLREEVGEK